MWYAQFIGAGQLVDENRYPRLWRWVRRAPWTVSGSIRDQWLEVPLPFAWALTVLGRHGYGALMSFRFGCLFIIGITFVCRGCSLNPYSEAEAPFSLGIKGENKILSTLLHINLLLAGSDKKTIVAPQCFVICFDLLCTNFDTKSNPQVSVLHFYS